MQEIPTDEKRRLVPRLRTFAQAVVAQELGSVRTRERPQSNRDELEEKLSEWKEDKSLGIAVEILSSAVVLGREAEVEAVAWSVLHERQRENLAPSVIILAEACTSPELIETRWQREALLPPKTLLRNARRSINEVGYDAITLVDMVYAYIALGKRKAAERAIKAAIALTPDSRLVLRAAARLWDHFNEPEVAREILLRSERTRTDPWLVAAEVALASRAKITPRLLKRGMDMVKSANYPARHLSELAGAIGTEVLLHDRRSKARPFFELSMRNPTENAIAQAGWAQRRKLDLDFNLEQWSSLRPDEATAWEARANGNWSKAIHATGGWLGEEPFSGNPAGLGVFLTSIVRDNNRMLDFATQGWEANPDSLLCANNLAFAEICNDDLTAAEKHIAIASNLKPSAQGEEIPLIATKGLFLMRRGLLVEGRLHYVEAVERAKKINNTLMAVIASAMRAREELRIKTLEAEAAIKAFDATAKNSNDPAFDEFRREFGILGPNEKSPHQKLRDLIKNER